MAGPEMITVVLTRVLDHINEIKEEYGKYLSSSYICPEIIPAAYMRDAIRNNIKDNNILVREWFETQRPTPTLHPDFYEAQNVGNRVWFDSDSTKIGRAHV